MFSLGLIEHQLWFWRIRPQTVSLHRAFSPNQLMQTVVYVVSHSSFWPAAATMINISTAVDVCGFTFHGFCLGRRIGRFVFQCHAGFSLHWSLAAVRLVQTEDNRWKGLFPEWLCEYGDCAQNVFSFFSVWSLINCAAARCVCVCVGREISCESLCVKEIYLHFHSYFDQYLDLWDWAQICWTCLILADKNTGVPNILATEEPQKP